jgi:hypothetical protein
MSEQTCPLWRGKCREHKCRWYTQVIGKNPNTGAQIDQWGCAIEFLPMLLIENAKEVRHGAAATESFRNEMVNANAVLGVMQQIGNGGAAPLQLTSEPE